VTKTFPVTYSTLSVGALVTEVLPDYDIGPVAECVFIQAGFNDTYRARTVQGDTYYLRVYRVCWRTRADVEYELDVLNHLKRKGVPAARPVPRRDGTLIYPVAAPEGTRLIALFTEAPGKEISYDQDPERVAYDYGRAVANLHNAVDDFSSQHERFHLDLDHLVDTPLRLVEPLLAHRPEDWRYLQQLASTVRQQIVDMDSELEQGFCHGDFQAYHANVGPDGTLTFFDFDCGGYGYRAYDLAVFRWCGRLENQEKERWEPFLTGYQELRPLNELDVQAIPLFVAARNIWHMGVHAQNALDWGYGALNDNYYDRKLGFLRAVEADYSI